MTNIEMIEIARDSRNESIGIIRTLKWVQFLMTYKSTGLIKEELKRFVAQEEVRFPDLKGIERY